MRSEKYDSMFVVMSREAANHSDCIRKKVGAVIARGKEVLVTAANGVIQSTVACRDGGCPRCASDSDSGEHYDSCLCVHAEQRAIAAAARSGILIDGATLYCTLRPCLTCVQLCLCAGIAEVVYDEHMQFSPAVETAYEILLGAAALKVRRTALDP